MSSKKSIDAVILAAGKGTRMNSTLPKVIHDLSGVPIIYYALDAVLGLRNKKDICVVLGYKADQVKKKVSEYYSKLKFCVQPKLNGSAKAVEIALKNISSEDVLIMCADSPVWSKDSLNRLYQFHIKQNADCTVLIVDVDCPKGLGRIIEEDSNLIAIKEEIELNIHEKGIKRINTGVYIFKRKVLLDNLAAIKENPKKKEYFLTDIIKILVSKKAIVKSFSDNNAFFFSVNNLSDLVKAQVLVKEKIICNFIQKGIKIIDPATTFIAPTVRIGIGTVINPLTFIEDKVKIGRNCSIGPFSRIREGSTVGDNSEVGNFSEMVRTKLSKNVKYKHFGYLGDVSVKDKVNIGAGVVVANFDGRSKNKTYISKNSFIGSDTVLVAPVKVGKNSLTAAGAVVTKNVKDNQVVGGIPARVLKRRGKW